MSMADTNSESGMRAGAQLVGAEYGRNPYGAEQLVSGSRLTVTLNL